MVSNEFRAAREQCPTQWKAGPIPRHQDPNFHKQAHPPTTKPSVLSWGKQTHRPRPWSMKGQHERSHCTPGHCPLLMHRAKFKTLSLPGRKSRRLSTVSLPHLPLTAPPGPKPFHSLACPSPLALEPRLLLHNPLQPKRKSQPPSSAPEGPPLGCHLSQVVTIKPPYTPARADSSPAQNKSSALHTFTPAHAARHQQHPPSAIRSWQLLFTLQNTP